MRLDVAWASPAAVLRGLAPRAGDLAARLAPRAAGWPERGRAARAAAGRWFAGRTSRERWLLGVLAALALAAAFRQLVWQPLVVARRSAMADIARYDRIAATIAVAGPDVTRIAAARTGTLAAIVTARAAKARLTIARLEPQGSQVAVSLDGVDFAALVDWLAALDREAGVGAVDLKVERRPDPGIVTVQVTLAER